MNPENNGLQILVRRGVLTERDWQKLVEARVEMLKKHFKDIPAATIGDLYMVKDYYGNHSLKMDEPALNNDPRTFTLETRAIFSKDHHGYPSISVNTEHHRDASNYPIATTEKFWGLTRDGSWITIEVFITRSQQPHRHRTEEVAKAEWVAIKKSTLKEMSEFSKRDFEYLWRRLGEVIVEWSKHRESLYQDAKRLADKVAFEEELLKLVQK